MARPFLRLLLAGVLLCLGAPRAGAQPVPRVTLVLRGTALADALAQLVERTQLDLAYSPELVRGRFAYCVTRDAAAEEALRCMLGGTGLDYYRLSNGTYVLTPEKEGVVPRGVLSGRVFDAQTGRPLALASVVLQEGTGTATGAAGQYAFPRLLPGTYELRVTYVGYQPHTETVHVQAAAVAQRDVRLEPLPLPIVPIVVDGLGARDERGFASATDFSTLAGAGLAVPDVVQRMAELPGVRIGNATADVHVQGGAAGEHDLRLDGAMLFMPPILLGLVGPLSPFAIGQIEVQRAGFGVQPGSNTVGVVEATQAVYPGPPARVDAQLDALSLNLRLLAGTPRTGRLMLTGREGLWSHYRLQSAASFLRQWNRGDTFLRAIFSPPPADGGDPLAPFLDADRSGGTPDVGFRDLHGAYQVDLGALSRLHVSGYAGQRRLDAPATPYGDRFTWDTYMGQARFTTVLNKSLYAHAQVRTSRAEQRHDYAVGQQNGVEMARDGNLIVETAAEGRLDYSPLPGVLVEVGGAPTVAFDRFNVRSVGGTPIAHLSRAWRLASFATIRARPLPQIQAELGFRATYLKSSDKIYPEPRVSIRYDSPRGRLGQLAIRLGAGLYEQFVGQYQISSPSSRALVSTSRVWMAMDGSVQPPRAEHYSAEVEYHAGRGWTANLDGYHKHQLQLYTIDYAAPVGRVGQAGFLTGGEGFAWGVGGRLEKQWRRNRVRMGLERSHVERGTALFGGNYYVVPWNEPWRFTLAADVEPVRRVALVARWESVWGRAWAFRQAYYDYLAASRLSTSTLAPALRDVVERHVAAYHLDAPEANTLPPYHRLDLGAALTVPLGGAQVQYRLDAINVLGRRNVAERQLVGDAAYYAETGLLRPENRYLLPFTLAWAVRLTL